MCYTVNLASRTSTSYHVSAGVHLNGSRVTRSGFRNAEISV